MREDEEKNSRQSELDSCSCTRFVLFFKASVFHDFPFQPLLLFHSLCCLRLLFSSLFLRFVCENIVPVHSLSVCLLFFTSFSYVSLISSSLPKKKCSEEKKRDLLPDEFLSRHVWKTEDSLLVSLPESTSEPLSHSLLLCLRRDQMRLSSSRQGFLVSE